MAELEVAVEAVAVLVDVIADLTEVGVEAEVIVELEAIQQTMGDTITAEIQAAMEDGSTLDEARAQALETSYNNLSPISEEAANNWAESMTEEGYEFNSSRPSETEEFEDTSPESNPDKGDPETPECTADPKSPECLAQTQSRMDKFMEFMKGKWGYVGGLGVATGFAIYTAFGQICRWVCDIYHRVKGDCSDSNQGTSQCIDGKCDSKLCDATKTTVTWIRTYWIELSVLTGMSALAATIYFKAMTPAIVGGVMLLVMVMLKSVLGNLFATVMCDVGASTCIFQDKPINC